MEIAIIGGGASGLAAAIAAAEDPRCQVTLVESHGRVGRKLLATGNGRCNLANANLSMGAYHGTDPAFAGPCLTRYGVESTLDFFRGLGLATVQEPSGRIYPWSDQAASVVDVLRFALNRPNVRLLTAWPVGRVKRTAQGFSLSGPAGELTCRRLIVACGGLAGTALGGSMSGYQLLRSLGHRCSRLRPALVPLKSDYPRCPSLKGVRANCRLALRRDGQVVAETLGEVQFTQYGLSGPAVFSLSRQACGEPGHWDCRMDLLPEIEAPLAWLTRRQGEYPGLTAGDLLTGMVHNRLGRVVVQEAGLALTAPLSGLTRRELNAVAGVVKGFTLSLTQPMGMDCAQVTAGGILTQDFYPETMESRLCPGLYACGEVLDIDGDCGGYNLQWAWSSGRAAGTAARKENP